MIKTKDVVETVINKKVISWTCNKCKKEYFVDDPKNIFEFQEFLNIKFVGGYGSVFGDSISVSAQICQTCLYDFIGDVCEYGEGENNES